MIATFPSFDTGKPFDIIMPSMNVSNQKQLMRHAAEETAKYIGISARILAERLNEKEKSSPSAMGEGASITHLQLSGLKESLSLLFRLKNPIPMKASDGIDVDLVCILLTPEREGPSYLRTMARLSRLMRNQAICKGLRAARSDKEMHALLEQSSIKALAA